jgi:hypothetical protein
LDEALDRQREALPVGVPEPPPPQEVSIVFRSEPAGATVSIGERELGLAPLVAPVPAGEDPISVKFSLDGYRSHSVRLVPTAGAEVVGRLRRLRPSGRVTGGAKSIKMTF